VIILEFLNYIIVGFDYSVQFMGLLLVEAKMVPLNALICAKNLLLVELALLLLLMMLIKYVQVQLTSIQLLHIFVKKLCSFFNHLSYTIHVGSDST
jgi:hypothetical protein